MDDSYAKQKFYEAVASLIGTGSIQKTEVRPAAAERAESFERDSATPSARS